MLYCFFSAAARYRGQVSQSLGDVLNLPLLDFFFNQKTFNVKYFSLLLLKQATSLYFSVHKSLRQNTTNTFFSATQNPRAKHFYVFLSRKNRQHWMSRREKTFHEQLQRALRYYVERLTWCTSLSRTSLSRIFLSLRRRYVEIFWRFFDEAMWVPLSPRISSKILCRGLMQWLRGWKIQISTFREADNVADAEEASRVGKLFFIARNSSWVLTNKWINLNLLKFNRIGSEVDWKKIVKLPEINTRIGGLRWRRRWVSSCTQKTARGSPPSALILLDRKLSDGGEPRRSQTENFFAPFFPRNY